MNPVMNYDIAQGFRARSLVWLESSAHNRVVAGSNPAGPITTFAKRVSLTTKLIVV